MNETSCCFTTLLEFGVDSVLNFSHSNRCVVVAHCFNLQFPNDIWCWASFYMLICHLHIFFGEVSVQIFCPFFFLSICLFIYLWLCWVLASVRGLSLVVASGDHSSSRCAGLSLSRPPLLRSTGSRRAGSVIVAHGLSCYAACGILPDQGSNPRPPHWQADPQPLHHQGSPAHF